MCISSQTDKSCASKKYIYLDFAEGFCLDHNTHSATGYCHLINSDIFGTLESEKVPKFDNYQENLVEFRVQNVIYWLGHNVPIVLSTVDVKVFIMNIPHGPNVTIQ